MKQKRILITQDEVPSPLRDPSSSFAMFAHSPKGGPILVEIQGIRTTSGDICAAIVQQETVRKRSDFLEILRRIAAAYQVG